jgi:hypothetical protein
MQRSDFLLAVIDERYLSVAKVPSSHSASRARRDCLLADLPALALAFTSTLIPACAISAFSKAALASFMALY